MKNLILITCLLMASLTSFAQFEKSINDTTATSQATRAEAKYFNAIPYQVQKGKLPRRLGFYDEITAASAGGVQSVNSISPTGGNVNITFANLLSKPTTISGFGITDGVSTTGSYTNPAWLVSIPFSKISSPPTTISGYGITDAVNSTGSYANPAFITSLAASKVTGLATVATSGLFADIGTKPTTVAGYGITDAVISSQIFPVTNVSAYSGLSGVTAPSAGFLKFVTVATDSQYGETQNIYIVKPNGKIHKIALLPSEN